MKVKKINEKFIQEVVDTSKESGDVLLNTYSLLFDWNREREIKPSDFVLSRELCVELIDAEGKLCGNKEKACLLWLQHGPSTSETLARNEIATRGGGA